MAAPAQHGPGNDRPALRFSSVDEGGPLLLTLGLIVMVAGVLYVAGNLIAQSPIRPGGILLLAIGILTLGCVRAGRVRLAANVLCWSLVVGAWVNAFLVAGISGAGWISVPVAVMLGGWLLGRSEALALATVGSLGVLVTYLLQSQGLVSVAPPPPGLLAFVLILAIMVTAVIGSEVAASTARRFQEVEQARKQLARAQALAKVGNWTMDVDTGHTTWSDEDYRMFGLDIGTPINYQTFYDRVHPDDRAIIEAGWAAARKGEKRFELSFRIVIHGETKWIRSITEFVHDKDGKLVSMYGTQQDVSDQKLAAQRIEYLAFHDDLTGLPNREAGLRKLAQAMAVARHQGARLAVLCVDLDHFKYVNDTHGQALGDELLQHAASRMRGCLDDSDLLSRLDGDAFMVVLTAVPERAMVEDICTRLQERLAMPFDVGGHHIAISASIGIACYPDDAGEVDNAEVLMRCADTARLEAQKLGESHRVYYERPMKDRRAIYMQTRDSLRQAMDRGELALCYQPKIELATGRPVGAEALFRWRHADGQLSLPANLVRTAEDSGLIVPIGRWALQEACQQAAAWQAGLQPGLTVAVNLSAVQFRFGSVERDVADALSASGLDPRLLEVELTESLLLHHDDAIHDALETLKNRGVQLSIDDFGTGYSSLAYLRRFAIDKLKIDRTFTLGIQGDERDRCVLQAILDIARGLKFRTIAEGVEDEALAATLYAMGCDEAQGYLYAKPLTAPEFEAWLASYTPRKPAPPVA